MVPRDKSIPRRQPGVIFVKEVFARQSKAARAEGAAAETEAGHVHMVGARDKFEKLELQLTTWVPGTGQKSPNRLDGYSYLVSELRGLGVENVARQSKAAVEDAAKVNAEIRRALGSASRGRRVGL